MSSKERSWGRSDHFCKVNFTADDNETVGSIRTLEINNPAH